MPLLVCCWMAASCKASAVLQNLTKLHSDCQQQLPMSQPAGTRITCSALLASMCTYPCTLVPSTSIISHLLLYADEQQAVDFMGALSAVSQADDGTRSGDHAQPAATHSDSVGRRLQQGGAAGGETRFTSSVVGCRGSDCRGYRVQASRRGGDCGASSAGCEAVPGVAFRTQRNESAVLACKAKAVQLSCREPALAPLRLRPSLLPRLQRWPGWSQACIYMCCPPGDHGWWGGPALVDGMQPSVAP